MPKKVKELTNNINVRITDEQKERWNKYLKEHKEFSSASAMIRWCVDEVVEGTYALKQINNGENTIKNRTDKIDGRIEEIEKNQRDILKLIAQKTSVGKKIDTNLREYQKGLLINLLQKESMNDLEIGEIFDDLTEIEILNMLNDLMESSIIEQGKNSKYKVIK